MKKWFRSRKRQELLDQVAELELQTRRQALAFAFIREQGLSLEWGSYLNSTAPVTGVWDQLRADELRINALVTA